MLIHSSFNNAPRRILTTGCCAFALLAAAISCTPAQTSQEPLRMIIETDMGNDIDDALALATALRAMDQGKVQVLAVGCHKASATAAPFTDIVCTYYGHPEVEVAMSLTPVQEFSDYVDYTSRPSQLGLPASQTEYPDPVKVYRRILAESPDHSVQFASFGFGTTLAQLLESQPDEYSPLDGVQLVAKKAGELCIMAGSYGGRKRSEYNVRNDIPAMQKVFELWPNVIRQNPFEIGENIKYPGSMIEQNLGYTDVNPVVEAYKDYKQMPYDRPSWDLLSVVYFLRPDLFTMSGPGKVTVDDEGYTYFEPCEGGKHYVMSATIDQPLAILDCLVEMTKAWPNRIMKADAKLRGKEIAKAKKLICFDLDATLTAHRCPLEEPNRALLDSLVKRHEVIMVCAGNCPRVYGQMGEYPVTILGNYGMQESQIVDGEFKIVREDVFPVDTAFFLEQTQKLREKYGYTEYYGDPVEFHKTGMVTFGLLGKAAPVELKHVFDPDRAKRRVMYDEVCGIFSDYSVYIGGSSSFDFSAKQYNKYDAVARYAGEHGYTLDEVLFVGDDFGDGGGDSHVRIKGMDYIQIDDYSTAWQTLAFLYQ